MKKSTPGKLSEDFLQQIVDLTPSLIAVYNIQTGKYVFVSQSLNKILGYEVEDWTQGGLKFVIPLVHPDDLPQIMQQNQEALIREEASKKPPSKSPIVSFEYRLKHKDGNYRWLYTDGTVFNKDAKGRIEHVINISIDITQRKEMEEKLKNLTDDLEQKIKERTLKLSESEERYKTFMAQSSEAIWRFELEKPVSIKAPLEKQIDHFYRYAYLAEGNDTLAKMYGAKSINQLIGVRLGEMLIRSDPSNIKYLKSFIKSGYRLIDAESHEVDKNGKSKYFLNSLIGIVVNDQLIRAWGTQTDITQRRLAEQKISENEQQLQSILDGSSQVIFVKDIDGRYILINKQYEENYKVSREKIKNKTDFDIFPSDIAKQLQQNDQEVLNRGQVLEKEETVIRDGQVCIYLSVKFPLKDRSGKIYAICGIATDITERKALENQKDEFISIASHELKTPVATISGYAQILSQRISDDTNHEYISKMNREINRLTALINDLLDVSRIQSRKLILNKEKTEINKFIASVVNDLQSIYPSHEINFKQNGSRLISIDRDRVSQILANLISNAVKFSPRNKKINVALKDGKDITISVQDFGIGISPRDQSKIFEPFFQSKNRVRTSHFGLGLGLHISKNLVEAHNGRIWVTSQKGEGSKFSFTLPV